MRRHPLLPAPRSLLLRPGGHHQRGVTLVELVLTIVIVSVAVAGVVGAFSLVTGRSADPLIQARATALGQLYLDEILARNYDVNTGPGGVRPEDRDPPRAVDCTTEHDGSTPRGQLRSIGEYNGLEDSASAVEAAFGATYQGFTVRVQVACAGDQVGGFGAGNDQAKQVRVIITDSRGNRSDFSAYRGNF